MITPYDLETMLLGAALDWGKEVTNHVLPYLTGDKFIYGPGESLGNNQHRVIWQAVEQCVQVERSEPFVGNVSRYLTSEVDKTYLDTLVGLLHGYHRIHRFDPESVKGWAKQIDRNGIIYRYASLASELGKVAQPETFIKYVGKVDDVDAWASSVLREFQGAVSMESEASFQPIAKVVERAKELADRQAAGEQMILLPSGWPILYRHGLFPAAKFAVIHGWSSAGKSMFVHLVNLGTAIGLIKANMRGLVSISSLEMSDIDFAQRSASALAGFNAFTLMGEPEKIDPITYKRYQEYLDFVGKLPIVIDSTPAITPDKMRLNLTNVHLSEAGPIRQHSSDYFELFDSHVQGRKMSEQNREQELSYVAKEHYLLSRELGCSVMGISQSTYGMGNKTLVAGVDGMRYSKAITHKADIVLEVINYLAAEKAGKDFVMRAGLNKEQVWVLVQKYKGGPTDVDIPLGWEPEYTRLYDPTLIDEFGSSLDMFEHLYEVAQLLKKHPTTKIIPIADTPIANMDFS